MQAIGLHCASAVGPRPVPRTNPARAAQRTCSRTEGSSRAPRRSTWQQLSVVGSWWRRNALAAATRQEEQQIDAWGEPIAPGEVGILDKDIYTASLPDAIEGKGGYTPYELIDFTDIHLKHEVVLQVERPVSEVYALWENRLNWPEWFGMIEEVGFKEGDDSICALDLWYRWAMTPWLELYVALRRTAEQDKYIVEEPEDGAPLVAAVLFQEEEGEGSETPATLVTLRVSYLLPRVLYDFAGQLAVYGDVDRKLAQSMARMKEWVEGVDFEKARAAGEQNMADIRAGLPEHRQQQQAADAKFEAEKQRWQVEQEQQQVAAMAAVQSAANFEAEEAEAAAIVLVEEEAAAAVPPPPASKAKRSKKFGADSPVVANPMAKRGGRKSADSDGQ